MPSHLISSAAVAIALSVSLVAPARAQKAGLAQSKIEGPIQWSESQPAESGVDGATLSAIYSDMAQETHHDLKGIVIVRDGHLVSEHYFNGDSAESLHDIRSATKSVTSLLVGIAIQKGLVHNVEDSISLYLPGLPKDGKENVTVKDLLFGHQPS